MSVELTAGELAKICLTNANWITDDELHALFTHIDAQADALRNWKAVALGLQSQMEAPASAVRRVLALHEHRTGRWFDYDGREWFGESCAECRDEWPCATAEALGADR